MTLVTPAARRALRRVARVKLLVVAPLTHLLDLVEIILPPLGQVPHGCVLADVGYRHVVAVAELYRHGRRVRADLAGESASRAKT